MSNETELLSPLALTRKLLEQEYEATRGLVEAIAPREALLKKLADALSALGQHGTQDKLCWCRESDCLWGPNAAQDADCIRFRALIAEAA